MKKLWTDEQLINAVAEHTTLKDVFKALGLQYSGSGYGRMMDYITIKLNLDISHWKRVKHRKVQESPYKIFWTERTCMQIESHSRIDLLEKDYYSISVMIVVYANGKDNR